MPWALGSLGPTEGCWAVGVRESATLLWSVWAGSGEGGCGPLGQWVAWWHLERIGWDGWASG